MEVSRDRASRIRPPAVLARYRSDRFSRPGLVPFLHLREMEDAFIDAVPKSWDWVVPSPLVPVGTHVTLGRISQDWVLTTVRANEVAADPTVSLALEAAAARSDTSIRRTAAPQRLATIQRILRGQLYASPEAFTHFSIFALVTAGRSQPGGRSDVEALEEQLGIYANALSRFSESVEFVLSTADTSAGHRLIENVRHRWDGSKDVLVSEDRRRISEQRYYRRGCFKVNAVIGRERIEIADGGFTDWTERLLGDRHERLLISGAGLDRPALALREAADR